MRIFSLLNKIACFFRKPKDITPIVLFAYNRPECLKRVLDCLKADRVPLIYAFCDGSRNPSSAEGVAEVRRLLHSVDWCRIIITERKTNLGLGKSLVLGVTEVLERHDSVIVYEDDLITSPGAFQYMSAALKRYRDDQMVMSVTAWTHPRVTPSDAGLVPYFDGRAECWVWGTWRRAWTGMESTDAMSLVAECRTKGIDPCKYGDDLLQMAETEHQRNIWAVRWLYMHIVRGGLCLRPPHSISEHIGTGPAATNTTDNGPWTAAPLQPCPPIPEKWPKPKEKQSCVKRWQTACGHAEATPYPYEQSRPEITLPAESSASPEDRPGFSGHYIDWDSAAAACGDGYGGVDLISRVLESARKVKDGEALYERDGVIFNDDNLPWQVLAGLLRAAAADGGALRVLDFGGSLGSSYFQCRGFLSAARLEKWCVVEQEKFVEIGRAEFSDEVLAFSGDLIQGIREYSPNVILLSGVLPYIKDPHELLNTLVSQGIRNLIFDRTPFWRDASLPDRLTVETVPPMIYSAKYPAWFFNEEKFLQHFSLDYKLIKGFDSWEFWEVEGAASQNRGFIFERF